MSLHNLPVFTWGGSCWDYLLSFYPKDKVESWIGWKELKGANWYLPVVWTQKGNWHTHAHTHFCAILSSQPIQNKTRGHLLPFPSISLPFPHRNEPSGTAGYKVKSCPEYWYEKTAIWKVTNPASIYGRQSRIHTTVLIFPTLPRGSGSSL